MPQTMYLVLVTNKSSNILEDLETLRLCGKVIPEYVEALEEEEVGAGRAAALAVCLLALLLCGAHICAHSCLPACRHLLGTASVLLPSRYLGESGGCRVLC